MKSNTASATQAKPESQTLIRCLEPRVARKASQPWAMRYNRFAVKKHRTLRPEVGSNDSIKWIPKAAFVVALPGLTLFTGCYLTERRTIFQIASIRAGHGGAGWGRFSLGERRRFQRFADGIRGLLDLRGRDINVRTRPANLRSRAAHEDAVLLQ